MTGAAAGGERERSTAVEPSVATSERILALLQLDKVAIADQLARVIASFRAAQAALLVELLDALQSVDALAHVAAHFDRKLDVKSEMERYLHDLLKMHHYITHHSVDAALTRRMMQLYGAFGDSGDRQLLTKVFQTLGFALCAVFCALCAKLSPKHQQELLTLFADDLPELRTWIQWLAAVRSKDDRSDIAAAMTTTSAADDGDGNGDVLDAVSSATAFSDVLQLFMKTVLERCTLSWLALLRPLPHAVRIAVVREVNAHLPSTSLKQLTRFYETSGLALQTYLELDRAVRRAMPTLLNEFPAATLQTLFAKFNSAKLVQCVLVGLDALPKRELLRLVDALGIADTRVIGVFAGTLFQYTRLELFARLFLTFSTQNQLHFLNILRDVAAPVVAGDEVSTSTSASIRDPNDRGADAVSALAPSRTLPGAERSESSATQADNNSNSECAAAWRVFDLFLDAHFHLYDVVVQKLSTLPSAAMREMVAASVRYSPEELSTLGKGIESVASSCLPQFLRIFAALPTEASQTLVKWSREVPSDDATPIYDVLLAHLQPSSSSTTADDASPSSSSNSELEVAIKMLELVSALTPRDKRLLCTEVLVRTAPPPLDQQQQTSDTATAAAESADTRASALALNDSILRYLCACTMTLHKAVKLFRLLPASQYERLIFLLRTQRLTEQVALARLMLSLPSDANCRLLEKLQSFVAGETLDLFFELLLVIPQVEYRSFAKLLVSPNVSREQLQCFVQVAASLMNQASSRELVLFTADLPVLTRNLFFDMLAHEPVKGVLLRIVACASKLSPELLHELLALLHPLSWSTRSSLVEQIRALESASNIESLVAVARELAPRDLERLVLLLNVLQVPVRVAFVDRILPLARHEKRLAIEQLDALPKATLQTYCTQVCAAVHDAVGSAFLRVFGLLDSAYHAALLALLQHASCWPLLTLLADCVARTPEPSLLNGFAAALALLTHEHELLVLRSVVEEALATATSLHALVLVLCHFRSAPRLLALLTFAQHLGRFARSTVFFRVLAQYRQTVFLFDVCRMLDLDDALFALARLDRLRHQHHAALDDALDSLANRFAASGVEIKDEFCNVILGFHERDVSVPVASDSDSTHQPRCIAPRPSHFAAGGGDDEDVASALRGADTSSDADDVVFLPSTRSMVHPALSLERYLRRAQSEDTLAQRWLQTSAAAPSNEPHEAGAQHEPPLSNCSDNNAHGWSLDGRLASTPIEVLEHHGLRAETTAVPASGSVGSASVLPSIASSTTAVGSRRSTSTSVESIASRLHQEPEPRLESARLNADDGSCNRTLARGRGDMDVLTTLPPLISQPPVLRAKHSADTRPRSGGKATDAIPEASAQWLSRAESAPTTLLATSASHLTLSSSPNEGARRYRGLAAALDTPSDCPIVRDRGASIFRKECEAATAEANGTCRIRVAKSLAAQAHVNSVRVQHALGKRDAHGSSALLVSPLLRPDRHTFEQATAALALAARARQVNIESLCSSIK